MNKLNTERRAAVVRCLVEGCSIRSTVRMTGVAKNTIAKLLVDLGFAAAEYQHQTLRNLPCRRLELDEIWCFCYAKSKNVPEEKQGQFGYGDVWTWVAVCAETKLVPCWLVGPRNGEAAIIFVRDLASRLRNRVQITTDGLKAYLEAVEQGFGGEVDYAMLVKHYGTSGESEGEKRYSPARMVSAERERIVGSPDMSRVSTSYAERQNLTMRMMMRRFTRLTNGFSKKVENHACAVAIHYMYYNFARRHQTLRVSPAMAAGVTDHLWSVEEIVGLLEKTESHSN